MPHRRRYKFCHLFALFQLRYAVLPRGAVGVLFEVAGVPVLVVRALSDVSHRGGCYRLYLITFSIRLL